MQTTAEREHALIRLKFAQSAIAQKEFHARLFMIVLWAGFVIGALGALASYLMLQNLPYTYIGGGTSFVCAFLATVFWFIHGLLDSQNESIRAQIVDFQTKEDALARILEHISDVIMSEFRKLGFPRRGEAEVSLDIAKTLSRDLQKLSLQLHDAEGEVTQFMRELRESEGLARLTNLSPFLSTTGFNHDAVEELFSLLREHLEPVLEITRTKPVSTEHGVRLIMAAQMFDEAMQLIRDYHDEASPVTLADIRAERDRKRVAAE